MTNLIPAANIKQSKANPNKGDGRKMMMPWHIGRIPMSSNAFRAIIHIVSAYGSDGKIVFKRKTLSELCQLSLKQLDAVIIELKNIGLIETKRTGRSLRFYLSDIFWQDQIPLKVIDSPARENKPVSSPSGELRVPPQGNSPIKDEKNLLKEKKKPDPLPKAPKKPAPTAQPTAGPFSKNQIEKMGDHAPSIVKSCDEIKSKLKLGERFNPYQAVGGSLKDGKQPGAIAETLTGMAKNWKTIEIPWRIYESQLKIKNQNWNAIEHEKMSRRYKNELINGLKGISDAMSENGPVFKNESCEFMLLKNMR